MIKNFEIIFSQIQPYKFLTDLNVPIKQIGRHYYAKNPDSQEFDLFISQSEIISTDFSDNFNGGNIVDFYAYYFTQDYTKAVKYFLDTYKNIIQTAGVTDGYYIDNASKLLETHRKVLNWLNDLRTKQKDIVGFERELQKLRSCHVDPMAIKDCLLFCKDEHLDNLLSCVIKEDKDMFNISGDYFIILPYFKSFGKVAYIKVINIRNDEEENIPIEKTQFSFLNYKKIKPWEDQKVHLFYDYFSALGNQSFYQNNSYFDNVAIALHYDPKALHIENKFSNVVYHYKYSDNLTAIDDLRQDCNKFFVTTKQKGYGVVPTTNWSDFIASQLISLIQNDNDISTRVRAFINQIEYDEVKEDVEDQLYKNNLGRFAEELNKGMNKQNIFSFGNLDILERDYGYDMKKKNSLEVIPITNFTVNFKKTVIFNQTNEIYYKGYLNVANEYKVPIFLSQKDLQNSTYLNKALAQTVSNKTKESKTMPVILDSTMANKIIDVFRRNTADTKIEHGLDILGWSTVKDSFTTPHWTATNTEIIKTKNYPHPNTELFQYFYFGKNYIWENESLKKIIDKNTVTFISIIVSQFVRNYLELYTPVIPALDDLKTRNLLKFIYFAFGQQEKLFNLPQNKRRGEKDLLPQFKGYPLYGTCPNYVKFSSEQSIPIMLLNPSYGLVSFDHYSKKDYQNIAKLSTEIFQETARYLLDGSATLFYNQLYDSERINSHNVYTEGLEFIKRIIGMSDWELYPEDASTVLHFICTTPNRENKIKKDFENKRIVIDFRDSHFRRKSLTRDAKFIDKDCYTLNPWYLSFSEETIYPILEKIITKDQLKSLKPFHSKRTKKQDDNGDSNVIEM